jgi:hypothetical protein
MIELNETQKQVILEDLVYGMSLIFESSCTLKQDAKKGLKLGYECAQYVYDNAPLDGSKTGIFILGLLPGAVSNQNPQAFKELLDGIVEFSKLIEGKDAAIKKLTLDRLSNVADLTQYTDPIRDFTKNAAQPFLQDWNSLLKAKGRTPDQLRNILNNNMERLMPDTPNSYANPTLAGRSR